MNRRNLLKSLFVVPFLSLFNWKNKDWHFKNDSQIKFHMIDDEKYLNYICGTPYHENNGSTSEWLGIKIDK